jgi:hypothetical protein
MRLHDGAVDGDPLGGNSDEDRNLGSWRYFSPKSGDLGLSLLLGEADQRDRPTSGSDEAGSH